MRVFTPPCRFEPLARSRVSPCFALACDPGATSATGHVTRVPLRLTGSARVRMAASNCGESDAPLVALIVKSPALRTVTEPFSTVIGPVVGAPGAGVGTVIR